jgi:hypothetical protein
MPLDLRFTLRMDRGPSRPVDNAALARREC